MGCVLCCHKDSNSKVESPKVAEYSWDQKKKLNPKDFTIENIDNGCVGRLAGSINGEQFIIQNCKNSRIYLLDHIGTISVDDCTNCDIIIGPIKTSIFIRDCSYCNIIVACQQFRTRDCHHINVFLSCTSQPIIESTTKFKVAPYQLYYPQLLGQFKAANLSPFNCNWSDIYDFTPVPDQGLNFSLLPEDTRPFQLLTPPSSVLNTCVDNDKGDSAEESEFSKKVSHLEITDAKEQSVVPYTYGNRRSVATTEATKLISLVVIFHCDSQQELVHRLIRYVNEKCNGMFLIKTREMKLSIETAKNLFGDRTCDIDHGMQGPIISLQYVGNIIINDVLGSFKTEPDAIKNIDTLIYVSPDQNTSRSQIDLINNVTNMGMNSA